MRIKKFEYEFVHNIPGILRDGVLYISLPYKTASHKCACGCGREVVTPISPVGWKIIYDGDSVTLHPSIGNFSNPCKSHYFIRNNMIMWAERYSEEKINKVRKLDETLVKNYFNKKA